MDTENNELLKKKYIFFIEKFKEKIESWREDYYFIRDQFNILHEILALFTC